MGMMEATPHPEPGSHRPETVAIVSEPPAAQQDVKDISSLLEQITADAVGALGANLVTLLMYGSHPRGEARPSSDVNLMIVVSDSSAQAMSGLLAHAQEWSKAGAAAPVVITALEFLDSQDTLALEYLDIASSRRVLAGHDLFATFTPDWEIVRHALEQEARRKAIILMKRWLVTAGKGRDARRIIADTIPGYIALLRSMVLYEQRITRPLHAKQVFDTMDGRRGLDPSIWHRLYDVGREYKRATSEQLVALMMAYIDQSQMLMKYLDSLDEHIE